MKELFYSLAKFIYGRDLAYYLFGYDCNTQSFTGEIHFYTYVFQILFTVLILCFSYYYLPLKWFNHPKTNRIWNWLIMLFFSGILVYLLTSQSFLNDFETGGVGACLRLNSSSSTSFGVINFFVSIISFFVLSLILKRKSINCKCVPF